MTSAPQTNLNQADALAPIGVPDRAARLRPPRAWAGRTAISAKHGFLPTLRQTGRANAAFSMRRIGGGHCSHSPQATAASRCTSVAGGQLLSMRLLSIPYGTRGRIHAAWRKQQRSGPSARAVGWPRRLLAEGLPHRSHRQGGGGCRRWALAVMGCLPRQKEGDTRAAA